MKLYNVPKNTWVAPIGVNPIAPPDAKPVRLGGAVFFKHIDGMYSYCEDSNGDVVHLPAWQDVEIIGDYSVNSR